MFMSLNYNWKIKLIFQLLNISYDVSKMYLLRLNKMLIEYGVIQPHHHNVCVG